MNTSSAVVPGTGGRPDLSARGLLIGLMVLIGFLYISLARDSYMNDFRAYYVAAVAAHDHLDPYTNNVNVSERYADGVWVQSDSRYVYPPTALVFFYPLQMLPYHRAKMLYTGLILLAFIGLLDLLHRQYPRQTIVLLMLFCSVPVFAHLDVGQVDIFILSLLMGAFFLKDGWKAGICLGVAIAIKLAPVLAVLWFLANRRWRTVAWSFVAGLAVALAVLPKLGMNLYIEYFHHLVESLKPNHHIRLVHNFVDYGMSRGRLMITPEGVYEFWHVIYRFRQNPLFGLGRVGIAIGFVLPVAFIVWLLASRAGRALSQRQSYFLFLVVCLFANPSLWPMGVIACFPLLILLVDSSRTPNWTALLLVAPLFLTTRILGGQNFGIFVLVAIFCMWQNGWLTAKFEIAAVGSDGYPA